MDNNLEVDTKQQENKKEKVNIKNYSKPEQAANIIANIVLGFGIIIFILCIIFAFTHVFAMIWLTWIGIGILTLISCLFSWSLLKMIINISNRLTNIDNKS